MNEVIKGKTYVHIESGKEVVTIDFCQMKIYETWHDAVIYQHNGKLFVRTVETFKEKFHE